MGNNHSYPAGSNIPWILCADIPETELKVFGRRKIRQRSQDQQHVHKCDSIYNTESAFGGVFCEDSVSETAEIHEFGEDGDRCGKGRRGWEIDYKWTVAEDNVQFGIYINHV